MTALLLVAAGYLVVWHSSLFALRKVTVLGAGGDGLSATTVEAVAGLHSGTPLPALDTGAAAARVARIPQVASAQVLRDWPHGARIVVVLRTAAALVPLAGAPGYREVDGGGVSFLTVPAPVPGLPVIRVDGGAALQSAVVPGALAALGALDQVDPALVREVQSVTASDPYMIMLQLTGGVSVDWGGADSPLRKARNLVALMQYKKADSYNVSAPDAPAVA